MTWRWLFIPMLALPAALAAACSASNGEAIPSEVRDADALDGNTFDPTDRDSSSTEEDSGTTNPPKDAGTKDVQTKDTGVDAPVATSAEVRINEVYVDRAGGGAKVEYVELRGPAGVAIDDLFIRVIDGAGKPSATTPYPVASTGQKMPASGIWLLGGALVSPVPDTVMSIPQGWDIDDKGAIQLVRGAASDVVDVVGWTTDADGGAVPQPTNAPKTVVEGKPFVLPTTGTQSFGRAASGADTNDNAKDFCKMNQSARVANGACL